MKLTNKLIERFGVDKVLHFFVAWTIVSLGANLHVVIRFVLVLFVIAIAYYKERKLDDNFDINDYLASIFGAITSHIYFIIV